MWWGCNHISQCPEKCALYLGSSWSIDKPKSRPADILVDNWDIGFSAAFDVSMTSSLNSLHIVEAGMLPGAAAKVTEERKHVTRPITTIINLFIYYCYEQ